MAFIAVVVANDLSSFCSYLKLFIYFFYLFIYLFILLLLLLLLRIYYKCDQYYLISDIITWTLLFYMIRIYDTCAYICYVQYRIYLTILNEILFCRSIKLLLHITDFLHWYVILSNGLILVSIFLFIYQEIFQIYNARWIFDCACMCVYVW